MRIESTYPMHFVQKNLEPGDARTKDSLSILIAKGKAVDVSNMGIRKYFPVGRVAISAEIHEQYVEWGSSAIRHHGVFLEADARLQSLLQSAAKAMRYAMPVYFVHKAVGSADEDGVERRVGLLLRSFDQLEMGWLICRSEAI